MSTTATPSWVHDSSAFLRADAPRRVLAGVAVAATVAGAVLTLALAIGLPLEGEGDLAGRLATGAFVVGMTGLAVAGGLLVRRQPGFTMAWLLVLTGLAGVLARASVGYALQADAGDLAGADAAGWLTNWSWVPAQTLGLLLLLRFPTGRLPGPRWRFVEWTVLGWSGLTLLTTAFVPGPLGGAALAPRQNPLGVDPLAGTLDLGLDVLFTTLPVLVVLSVAAPVARWRKASGDERRQLTWVAAAAVLIAVTAPLAVASDTGAVLEGVAFLALPGAITVAVLRHRLWDVDLVVRRTVVYALASIALASVYLGVVGALDYLMGGSGPVPALAAGLAVAAVAVPVRNLAQSGLDRLLFGDRRDPYAVVRSLGVRLQASGSDLLAGMVEELADSLKLPYVAVELSDGRIAAATGIPGPEGLRTPLVRDGRVLGQLIAGCRTPGEALTPLDVALLSDLSGHAGVTVHAVLLGDELRSSYERLRTVREEERSRLQRELHDSLGPVLGSVSMRAEAARNLLAVDADPRDIDPLLAGIGSATENALGEVRRLIDELRPTALAEADLVTAVREHLASYVTGPQLSVQVAVTLPRLDPRVEVVAYRVVCEGVRNAVRHADARCCVVRLSADAAGLLVEVVDDGRGLGDHRPGVGRQAMARRVADVGGTLSVADGTDGGVRVAALLPGGSS